MESINQELIAKARAQYVIASEDVKSALLSVFGDVIIDEPKKPVNSEDVTERVYNLETACQELGKDIGTLFGNETSPYRKAEIAIETFAEAMSQGYPDEERIYYPYFYHSSGGGFSCNVSDCDLGNGYSCVGARLMVSDAKKARHMGRCMFEYYRIYLSTTK